MLPEPSHRFENFVVGQSNRLAVAAARAVAEAPGAVYNPLFIYSSSGLGKTHLVGAIGNLARQIEPRLKVEYVTLDDFVDQLHAAIATGKPDSFKNKYLEVDMLLLDDTQFLTGKRETQSELLRLFSAWQSGGKQLVMTSDRAPSEISDVDERLINRLTGGLVVDIGSPELETRLAILRRKCEERQIDFPPGVLEELAGIDFSNVREMQGALNRLAVHQVAGTPGSALNALRPADVRKILGMVVRATPLHSPSLMEDGEFESFLSDVASVLAEQVEGWRVKIGEAVSRWSSEGFRTEVLQRVMADATPPDVDAVLRDFSNRVNELKNLEEQAAQVDPQMRGAHTFRDVESLDAARELVQKVLAAASPPPTPAPEFTRDGFEVGPSNELAVRVSDMVVAQPGSKYNPLFLHGPAGVGRTHLLHAIGNELVNQSGGAMRVAVADAQAFVDELVSAIQDGSIERFRARYRSADALLLDNTEVLRGKERSQDELFHLFNAFHAAGKQIVLAADRHPKDMDGLEERLRSRFEGGVVVAIAPPDRIVRERVLARHLGDLDAADEAKVLEYLAERAAESVREVIDVAYRLRAAADGAGLPLSVDFVRNELGRATPPRTRRSTPSEKIDAFFFDPEKTVWSWPDPGARLIEEMR